VAGIAFGLAAAQADVVLLDEHWSPEIMANDVMVTQIDTDQTGDPTQAVAGYLSAMLENDVGAPSVRFRNVSSIRPPDLVPGRTEARLWYRTDAWEGRWALDVWLFVPSAGRPVQFLQCDLNGGGEDGRLIADDRWHKASGTLLEGGEYDLAAGVTVPSAAYVWLRPTDGWDIPHRTYVDRVEVSVIGSPNEGVIAPRPARRVLPSPGAQMDAPGMVMFEGEDVTDEPFPESSAYLPDNADEQRLLSNGDWLQSGGVAGATAAWDFSIAEAGRYALWARGFWYRGGWRWRIDGGEWTVSGPDRELVNAVHYRDIDEEAWGQPDINIAWTPVANVDLASGAHTLEIEGMEGALGFGFDCWVLAKDAFGPE
jgi:hypothetical protein